MSRKPGRKTGTVRIIGGEWRGRRLAVAEVAGLRPSGDRGRETLFNWLQTWLPGADCVDLFAGSGALGFEAASRGARSVVLIERDRIACRTLKDEIGILGAEGVELIESDAIGWLQTVVANSIDIAFVDPPFDSGLGVTAWKLISESEIVRHGGFVYFETSRKERALLPAPGWSEWRSKALGDVRMQMFRRDTADDESKN